MGYLGRWGGPGGELRALLQGVGWPAATALFFQQRVLAAECLQLDAVCQVAALHCPDFFWVVSGKIGRAHV